MTDRLFPLPALYLEWKPLAQLQLETFLPAFLNFKVIPLPGACIDHIAYSTISAGLQLNVRIWSSIWFGIYGGHTLYRRFEPRNEKDQSISDQIQRMPDAWLIRGGVTWRLPRSN
ncbi:MAG TPA: hypothetical protein VJV78_46350 [Polyangiales bacterium]|nr:hypothetical protein [Polyangiales bacterium]